MKRLKPDKVMKHPVPSYAAYNDGTHQHILLTHTTAQTSNT